MAWRAILTENIQGRLTASERAMLAAASGVEERLQERLTDSIRKFIGGMSAAGYEVNLDDSVPDQLRNHIMSDAVWEWLKDFPQLKAFQTEQRKQAAADSEKAYERIITREYGAIESPEGSDITTGNWNSENKLIMRTHPTTAPFRQFAVNQFSEPDYANPNAPDDVVKTNSPGIPSTPGNLVAVAKNQEIVLSWDPALNATTYNVYRGVASGQESEVPIASALTASHYTDTGLVNGTIYYYKVASVNSVMTSVKSSEVSTTPTATPA